MPFDLPAIEALAPDQSSLTAASKLNRPAKWSGLAHEDDLWWGEAQGSGANPYRVVVDGANVGYKCTCPSRKFPCKHSLALMWVQATAPTSFTETTRPQWVDDWMGRRRTTTTAGAGGKPGSEAGSGGTPGSESGSDGKSISEAGTPEPAAPPDPEAEAKKAAASARRAAATRASITDGLDELDRWIVDQVRLGLAAFADNALDRCRKIAARLVDAKAANLASRLDEMPSRLLAVPTEERPDLAVRELGKIVLLTSAWRTNPDDPQAARDVGASEQRDQVLADPDAVQVTAAWEVVGEQITTRRDGLVSHATWLLNLGADAPQRFALLLDFFPASAGRREQVFTDGAQIDATVRFYPSAAPLRAVISARADAPAAHQWPAPAPDLDPLAQCADAWAAVPWQLEHPVLLPAGRVVRADDGRLWWRADDGGAGLPLAGRLEPVLQGLELAATVGLWDGFRLTLLAAQTPLGRVALS
ncbi:MAG: SWIM zinc finger family protein [Micrococcales bacterium]|nr:SWIM zinc finger family protein [Micrococcales bacterium]